MKLLNKNQIAAVQARPAWLLAFDCAVNHGYLRGVSSSELDAMQTLYNEVTGTDYPPVNKACPTCVFELVKNLGRLYYWSLDALLGDAEPAPKKAPAKKKAAPRKKTDAKKK